MPWQRVELVGGPLLMGQVGYEGANCNVHHVSLLLFLVYG
jgi:hypothetical protein